MSTALSITAAPQESVESIRVSGRYTDAYRQARFIVGIGSTVKVIGYIIGALVFVGAFALSSPGNAQPAGLIPLRGQDLILGSAIVALVVIAHFWVVGTLVCSWGQHLMAGLDCAVNSSPFLSDSQRASAMSLY